jgi:hypothetical protein
MKQQQHEFTVQGVALDKESQMPIVILKSVENNGLVVPLWVGPFEASAIIIEMEGIRPPRPLTHDLLSQLFLRHGFHLSRVEFYGVVEGGFAARIAYRHGFRQYAMEVRPSDAVALSVRLKAPILISQEALDLRPTGSDMLDGADPASSDVLYLGSEGSETPLM